jgi:hypothetical protein
VGLVRLALPAALTLWFIWRARDNALFLLGIPVLMVMRGSVFFENAKPFWKPGRFDVVTLLMVWLTLVWVVTVARRSRLDDTPMGLFGTARVLPEELPLLGIAALIALHAVGTFSVSGDLSHALSVAAGIFYLVLGYLLVRGIACRATRAETGEFLAAVVIVNTVACGLFILHQGLHLPIYLGQSNISYSSGGQTISRATTFAPMFNLLALGFVLAKRRWTPAWLVVLAITLLAVLVSLTRTLLIAAVLGLLIAIVARELSRPDFGRVARRVGTIVLAVGLVIVGFIRLAPAYWSFLLKRFGEFTSGSGGQVQNWHLRAIHWDAVQRVVARSDLLFGIGFPKAGSNAVDARVYSYSSDMAWLPVMYRIGYVGLLLVGLLLAGFMARALWLSLKPPEARRELCLTFFITITLTVVMSFQMWTFMQPSIYPMGLWILAFVAAEALRPAEELGLPPAPAGELAAAVAADHRPHAQPS